MDSQDIPGRTSAKAGSQSPCVDHCTIDVNEICRGCFRTLDEIARWSSMSESDKRVTNQRCGQRREENSGDSFS
jgi:predicted Fe-S protein YdhL (DUF1289 family)